MTAEIIEKISHLSIIQAKNVLKNDGVIILPTDTNYNLVCDPWSKIAVSRIFKIKERLQNNPLSLFFQNPADWAKYGLTQNKNAVSKVIDYFWPGPLNIVLRKTALVPNHILNGGDTVALGCIANPVWQKVVSFYGYPVALTSANKSGAANNILVTKEIAFEQVGKEVDLFFIGAPLKNTTKSSTIIDFTGSSFKVLRNGDITPKQIGEVING